MGLKGTLGFLGFGNMGEAILCGLIDSGTIPADNTAVYDVDQDKCRAAEKLGVRVADSPEELARMSDTLVLAVKPQSMAEALQQFKQGICAKTLVISIAAGISIRYIQERLDADIRVVRVMPNTPALVNTGAAGIALSENCSTADADVAKTIFEAIGIAELVPEKMIDAVTALSGSGPAYFFYMVECLVEAAVAEGLDEDQATRLANQTILGAGRLLKESDEPASILREKVTSKGGTTEAALNCFRSNNFKQIVQESVTAAVNRAKELGK